MKGVGLMSYHNFCTASYVLLANLLYTTKRRTISIGSAVVAAAPAIRTMAVCSLMLNYDFSVSSLILGAGVGTRSTDPKPTACGLRNRPIRPFRGMALSRPRPRTLLKTTRKTRLMRIGCGLKVLIVVTVEANNDSERPVRIINN